MLAQFDLLVALRAVGFDGQGVGKQGQMARKIRQLDARDPRHARIVAGGFLGRFGDRIAQACGPSEKAARASERLAPFESGEASIDIMLGQFPEFVEYRCAQALFENLGHHDSGGDLLYRRLRLRIDPLEVQKGEFTDGGLAHRSGFCSGW